MAEQDAQSALLSALTTEHFVLQTAASTTVNESAARASIYIMSLSSALVATGFASQSRDVFWPFVAAVLPAVFLLGVFTIIRLVDISGEYMQHLAAIARIRGHYRTLIAGAADYFAADSGRWPEARSTPSLQLGPSIAFLTTTSTMVAAINNVVAGAGIALLAFRLLGRGHTGLAVAVGVAAGVVLMAAFLAYQWWRFTMFDPRAMMHRGRL